jgi:hypothetical protein
VHPRRQVAAQLKRPNFVLHAIVFFAISHVAAAWLFVQEDVVASVPAFVLSGVPEGAFLLLLAAIPLHMAARVTGAPSHAPSTIVMLGYIQSVMMLLVATGIMLLWTGLALGNPDFGPELRAAVYSDLSLNMRIAQVEDLLQEAITGAFLAAFVLANLIWLYAAGWLLVAIGAFRDMWRISRLRALAILILTAGMFSIAGAVVVFAATL